MGISRPLTFLPRTRTLSRPRSSILCLNFMNIITCWNLRHDCLETRQLRFNKRRNSLNNIWWRHYLWLRLITIYGWFRLNALSPIIPRLKCILHRRHHLKVLLKLRFIIQRWILWMMHYCLRRLRNWLSIGHLHGLIWMKRVIRDWLIKLIYVLLRVTISIHWQYHKNINII